MENGVNYLLTNLSLKKKKGGCYLYILGEKLDQSQDN